MIITWYVHIQGYIESWNRIVKFRDKSAKSYTKILSSMIPIQITAWNLNK